MIVPTLRVGTISAGSNFLIQLTAFLLEALSLFGQALGDIHVNRFDPLVGRIIAAFLLNLSGQISPDGSRNAEQSSVIQ